jgi:diguanylate cyclase (GGDEF)-like protein/PAS domain S-box-containing protein/putative nucleotidyltransferase with HDIG domain
MTVFRFSVPTRIAFSLASLVLALVCGAQTMGLIPDSRRAIFEGRRSLCEAVALQACLAAQREDVTAMKTVVTSLVDRNPSIKSASVHRLKGKPLVTIGDHSVHWATNDEAVTEKVEVPIFKGKKRWGSLEIAFEPVGQDLLDRWMPRGVWLGLCIAVVVFLVSRTFLRRILQHLDPASVIPERVRTTLDTLAEGVLVLDRRQRIVLANKSFATKVGRSSGDLQGKLVADFAWSEQTTGLPWASAMEEGSAKTGALLSLQTNGTDRRTFAVNATPILGSDGKGRGALATFDDVTSIEEKNRELEEMLEALRASRDEVRRQNRELEILANNDALTGCLNRRALFSELNNKWNHANASGETLSCIMVDIDHFKSINDTYGHAMGDSVLQMVSTVLRSNALANYIVARYGGEEFAVLLPATSLDVASEFAEKLRARVQTVQCADRQVTGSFGVSSSESTVEQASDLLKLADKALYFAKHSGRNRVITSSQVPLDWCHEEVPVAPRRTAPNHVQAPIPYHAVTALSAALAFRDPLTAEHSRRVANLCLLMAQGLLSERDCYLLEVAAQLHDIGKLGVPDSILLKPGPLTEDEWKVMSAHDNIGVEILNAAFSSVDLTTIVAAHHAWYGGHPKHPELPTGEAIPLPARILTIADAYDAMVSDRVYRKGRSRDDAIAELRRCSGTQFDPQLVERFAHMLLEDPRAEQIAKARPSALRLGLQVEHLTMALEEKNYTKLAHLAGHLAAAAGPDATPRLLALASELQHAAGEQPDMCELVTLTTELLQLCEMQQNTCLKELQTASNG